MPPPATTKLQEGRMAEDQEVLNGLLYKVFGLEVFHPVALRQLISFGKLKLQIITVLALFDRAAGDVNMNNNLLREKQLQLLQFHSLDLNNKS